MDNFNEQQGFKSQTEQTTDYVQIEPIVMPEPPIAPQKKKKSRRGLKIAAGICAFAILTGTTLGAVDYYLNGGADRSSNDKNNSSISQADDGPASDNNAQLSYTELNQSGAANISNRENEITEVVKNAMPSMVSINVIATKTYSGGYFGGNYEYEVSGSGSGIIIGKNDTELLIVTNNHVVSGASDIAIEFIDGGSCNATIKGTDSDWDLAVVSVKLSDITDETMDKIKIAVMGDSDSLMLGECAIAIGNSLGVGQSVTVGYISATSRDVTFSDGVRTLIQTDAAINPGNSGGALLNINGEVIGINSAKYTSTEVEGMGYAIPITDAAPIINDLMNSIVVSDDEKAYLGIVGQSVPDSYQTRFGWPAGVYVSSVVDESPAQLAGLREGDIITSIDGVMLTSQEELADYLARCSVGDTVELAISRSKGNGSFTQITSTTVLIAKGDIE